MLDFYYWCGFLIGDGCFYYKDKKFKYISIDSCIKDKNHLLKFNNFFNGVYKEYKQTSTILSKNNKKCRSYLCKNKSLKIINFFNTNLNKKTYNPIKFSELLMTNNQKISFIIGLIDADGWIINQPNRKDFYLGLGLHKNWSSFLEEILEFLTKNNLKTRSTIKIYKNMCRLCIFDIKFLLNLYNFIQKNNLPVLIRKWEIMKNFKTRSEKADIDMKIIISYRNLNMTYKQISEKTGFTITKVASAIRRFKTKE